MPSPPRRSRGRRGAGPSSLTGAQIQDRTIKRDDLDVATLGVIPEARHAQLADTAGSADMLGGLTADQLKDRCPTGTVLDGGGCIETTLRTAATWYSAAAQCGAAGGGRLPTAAELSAYEFNARPTSAQLEWTSEILAMPDPLTFTVIITNTATGASSTNASNGMHAFRCVFAPTNK